MKLFRCSTALLALALMQASTALATPVNAPIYKSANSPLPASGIFVVDSTGADASDTSNHSIRVSAQPGGFSYTHISTNTTTQAKAGAGVLHALTINTLGSVDTITLYDNTACSGTVIAIANAAASQTTLNFDAAFGVGLCIATSGTTAPDITVTWR